MTVWEFKYVELHAGQLGSDQEAWPKIAEIENRIAELGREGWEPVGQFSFTWFHSHTINSRRLMFKRPTT